MADPALDGVPATEADLVEALPAEPEKGRDCEPSSRSPWRRCSMTTNLVKSKTEQVGNL